MKRTADHERELGQLMDSVFKFHELEKKAIRNKVLDKVLEGITLLIRDLKT